MRRIQGLQVGIVVTVLGAVVGGAAQAADMPLYDTPNTTYDEPQQQQLEFGNGWYLRGDGAYAEGDHPTLNAALGSFDRKATSSGYAFGLGAGYKLNSFVRGDVTADFIEPFDYQAVVGCGAACSPFGAPFGTSKTHVWRWDTLANGYFDLGTWYGITPYVGAGAGFGATRQDRSIAYVSPSPSSVNDYTFAWAGMAGFSYALAPHTLVDVGYRYIDLGRTKIQLTPVATTQKDLTAHQVRVGVRYMID